MKYTNKFVEFLNGANTIKISGVRDFNSLNSLCKKVGLSNFTFAEDYWCLLKHAQSNHFAINNITILVEYQYDKGFTFGYRSYEESEKWYGQKPWSMTEVIRSMKGE